MCHFSIPIVIKIQKIRLEKWNKHFKCKSQSILLLLACVVEVNQKNGRIKVSTIERLSISKLWKEFSLSWNYEIRGLNCGACLFHVGKIMLLDF